MAQLPPADPCASLQGQQILSIRTSPKAQSGRAELPRRRQNRSCDQCRKGKRACDAAIVGKTGSPTSSSTSSGSPDTGVPAAGPCSNCRRWRKECTFKWLHSVQTKSSKRRRKSETAQDSAECEPIAAALNESNLQIPGTYVGPPADPTANHENPSLWEQQDPLTAALRWQDSSDSSDLSGSRGPDSVEDDMSVVETDVIGFAIRHDEPMQHEQTMRGYQDLNRPQSYPPNYVSEEGEHPRRHALQSERHPYRKKTSSPPKTVSELLHQSGKLSQSFSRSALTQNLLRIYRDSMENALSCWLIERTCPYSGPVTLSGKRPDVPPPFSMKSEWGPNWSNRICTRVCRLDRAYSMIRGRSLTSTEEKAASRALHTSIMAFATQWTQTGRPIVEDGSADSSISPKGIHRSIQESCWNQAYKALNDSVGIESFRVVFAHIIFSLTLRPLNVKQHLEAMNARRCISCQRRRSSVNLSSGEPPSDCTCGVSDFSELSEILDSDKAPLFLETAVRQMYTYRHKLAGVQRRGALAGQHRSGGESPSTMDPFAPFAPPERRASIGGPPQPSSQTQMVLSATDYETFNLLFWLGIMFDTLSAVMYQRPPVVSDEDSDVTTAIPEERAQSTAMENEIDLNGWNMLSVYADAGKKGKEIWGDFFLDKRPVTRWKNITNWPCSYEEAAEILSDAAPVKVLIYRRLTRLQTLIYRGAPAEELEEAVQESLRVYQYWNHTYGRFMLGCVTHHESLPPRVQSWYILLAAHWHLAPILMADILDGTDRAGIGVESERESRRATHFSSALRKENAFAVSELARCCSHDQASSFSKAAEFHDAVNSQALLTEPWTAVLIRSFARAGYILLDGVAAPPSGEEPPNIYLAQPGMLEESRRRCQMCIDALRWIGRKSDMAFLAARALSDSYEARINGARRSTTSAEISEIPFPEVEVPDYQTHDDCSRDDILYPLVGSIAG
ncbi:transcriptional regulator family: Fungal Specific TF [Paecilomyces variotii]|nr:transcriptional regulator family: Fungal Specific TF [Paecilomyces variotii]KAJ9225876.1 transcriptional regulator family: Fungal Specific TF [Paecilomyces variotii]KAJ9239713.1 transcriptional regulator family: Fungal Specific TF [Paecilomyces variotii]KAJ9247629.1 transcriptional regulator family: Fungal Specific TF [Paecilomyces variotii]KAJ9309347.1 transcriptional regulator family: Fungal Specific TF [Paecilomyces variotii]